ncbi:MAG: hypothetical protein A2V98_24740 [Planctomycetes bacterium RBG_16_64_12]|nr:MAG: hypothetical protein A2V98_24740 [Planctomycetes bacterium RBG_16_64_12]
MEVKLVVVAGTRAGEEVPVAGPKFFIGRAEDCQLRPHSEMVSRHHCAIVVEEGFVGVRDFGSKNGTFVNGSLVRGEQELKSGDRLTVGDLEFEVQLGVSIGGKKKPKVRSVLEAAARTVESGADEMDLDSWLADTDTQTFETTHAEIVEADAVSATTSDDETQSPGKKAKKPAEIVGVWDKSGRKPNAVNPMDAAAETLKNFFKTRPG